MTVRKITQSVLDRVLLPDGITSHHLRRVEVDQIGDGKIKVNRHEYVVFRLVSSKGKAYGDGKAHLMRHYIDVNYYYSYEKNDARVSEVDVRIKKIIREFLLDRRFRLANGPGDIYDLDNPYRGINLEFLFIGAVQYE